MVTDPDLIRLWEAWDTRPSNDRDASRFESACQAYAFPYSLEFRRHIAQCRRDGMTRQEALDAWHDTFT